MAKLVIKKSRNFFKDLFVFILVFGWVFSGWPPIWQNWQILPKIQEARAATFKIQTGSYVGNGAAKSITGLGFSPELVILKADTTGGVGAIFKTTAMLKTNTAYLSGATADDTAGLVTLDPDGFTVAGTNSDIVNNRFTWIAFAGSDCSASGTFCVGTYIGNGTSPRAITTGFQTDLAWVKQSTAVTPNWRSSSMPANYGQYFAATAQETTGALYTTLDATGFTVGATNNASGGIYHYVAFKNTSGSINVGTYSGNATDNTNITGVGFVPDFVFLKNANAGTAVGAVYSVDESYGDSTSYFSDTANLVNSIQALQSDGFQIGSDSTSNGSGNTIYYAAFAGSAAHSSGSGTFSMATGSYTGTGNYITVNNLSFAPDLVIVKGNTTVAGSFRTRMMGGDDTAYLDSATADFTGGIVSLDTKGFTIGNSTVVNTAAVTYYWTAYGNAWNPDTNSGAADFTIGAFYGNGIDSRNITRLPFQPNLVTIKRSGASAGVFRTSVHSGDASSYFAATADAANIIQTFNSDGFQVGTAANVNTATALNWFFAFKSGTNFTVNSYSGTGSSQNITSVGFQPDTLWVKRTTAVQGVLRTSGLSGDGALPFINAASVANAVTGLVSNGFTVNTATETNASGGSYWYAGWTMNSAPPVISISVTSDGSVAYGILPASGQKSTIQLSDTQVVKNDGNVAELFEIKTSNATGGTQWVLGGSAGSDTFVHEVSSDSGGSWVKFAAADTYQSFAPSVVANATKSVDLRITAPTASTDYQQKTITVTIRASQQN